MSDETEQPGISFVVPVYNEAGAIADTLSRLKATLAESGLPYEIIIVDDGSHDESGKIAAKHDVKVIRHPSNAGYGHSLKSGIREATHSWIGIVDADGTYPIEELPALIEKMHEGFDMVVGHRQNISTLDRPIKRLFRQSFIRMVSFVLNQRVKDPNSGFRLFRRDLAMEYMPFLCEGFSFTTSQTVLTFADGRFVSYVPIPYAERTGRSKVRHIRDSMRTLQLVIQGITYANPIKIFLLMSALFMVFVLLPAAALGYSGWPFMAFLIAFGGALIAIIVGMGVLCDTIRIAIARQSADRGKAGREYHPLG